MCILWLPLSSGAQCARISLKGKQNTYFDHFFYGTYPLREISMGETIYAKVAGVSVCLASHRNRQLHRHLLSHMTPQTHSAHTLSPTTTCVLRLSDFQLWRPW